MHTGARNAEIAFQTIHSINVATSTTSTHVRRTLATRSAGNSSYALLIPFGGMISRRSRLEGWYVVSAPATAQITYNPGSNSYAFGVTSPTDTSLLRSILVSSTGQKPSLLVGCLFSGKLRIECLVRGSVTGVSGCSHILANPTLYKRPSNVGPVSYSALPYCL
jgi:hypothetical protein